MSEERPVPGMSEEDLSYVTRATRWTIFLRTFVPWQAWRFIAINLKMLRMILHHARRSQ